MHTFNRSFGEKVFGIVNAIVLALVALVMILPFFYIFVVSFTSYEEFARRDVIFWPEKWVLDSYDYILGSDVFMNAFLITVVVTLVGTLISLVLTSTMAYGLTKRMPGQRGFLFMVLFTFIFNAGMIPSYMVVKATGLINSYWSLIIPSAVNGFNLIVMRQFFMNLPAELSESAYIDGANDIMIFARITLPLSKPALAAFGLFYAVGYWNSYFNAVIYLNNPAKWTVQVVLRQMIILNETANALNATSNLMKRMPSPETVGMAAILVATVPILLVYPFVQKHFTAGIMLGSVKE